MDTMPVSLTAALSSFDEEPSQTLTTGDWHEGDIPAHVRSTTGQQI